jgi:hypothetical protein
MNNIARNDEGLSFMERKNGKQNPEKNQERTAQREGIFLVRYCE